QNLLQSTDPNQIEGFTPVITGFTNSIVHVTNATTATVIFTGQLGGGQTFDPFTPSSTLTGTNPTLTVTSTNSSGQPVFGYYGSDTTDGLITVTGNNLPPTAVNDSYAITERDVATDPSLTVVAPGVLANDTDPQGNPLTPTVITPPTHGTVTLNSDGSFV